MEDHKKLFLLDAFALIYRSHFAFIRNPRINSKGMNTSAVFGVALTILDVLQKEKPTHIAVVFDAPGGSVRNEQYEEYKAHREEMPEDIRIAIPYIYRLCEALKIPTLQAEGYEADDVIGTLSVQAEEAGYEVFMMTPDKDFGQLVTEKVKMYRPGRSGKPVEIWGVKEVCEKFEVEHPKQVIDILGLWGDAADNIPGIPGIGEKTSKKLIKQYGSVENLIANTDDLKGKQKENGINFAEQGLLSKKLATILLDAPVKFDEKDFLNEDPDKEKVLELFSELEFRTLARKVLGDGVQLQQVASPVSPDNGQMGLFDQVEENVEEVVSEFKTINDIEHKYTLINTSEEFSKYIGSLIEEDYVCFDTETSSLDKHTCDLLGVALSSKPHEAVYVSIPENKEEAIQFIQPLQQLFDEDKVQKIAHNIKFDAAVLSRYCINVKGNLFDTMIAHYLIEPEQKHSMDFLAETILHYKPVPIEELIGKKGKNQKSMKDLQPEEVVEYAGEDADITLQLHHKVNPKMDESPYKELFYAIEMPLSKVLLKMELEGIRLDVDSLNEFSEELEKMIAVVKEKIITCAGVEFNLDSPKQLGDVLFNQMKLDEKAKKTKTGQYKTDEETLSKLASKHEIVDQILNYRQWKKLKSTYVDALPELVNPLTGRIHTTYLQTVAATGRLSSNNPNLQNIPIRTDLGKEIRKSFIPRDENHILLAADYSQIELRIIAALSNDKSMIEDFKAGHDIHTATAAKVFDVSLEEVTREMRSKAKMVNFGIIYGISAFGLSQRLGIKRTEAKEIIDTYFEKYPAIKKYMDASVTIARAKGYVETIKGRRRYLKDINSNNATVRGFAERNAINAPIQGSAADIIKIAMIDIQKEMESRSLKSKMLLQVHDELVFDCHISEKNELEELVKHKMENAVSLSVPLTVESGFGNNWLEAH